MSSKWESKMGRSAGLFPNSFFCDALRYLLICCFPTLSFAAILPDEAGNGANQIAHIAGFSNSEKAQNGSVRPCEDSEEVTRKEEKSDTLSQQTAEQIRSLVRPGNSLELLQNIKRALANHWLLERDFFTSYNLCRLLGADAQDIQIIKEDGNSIFSILLSSTGRTVSLSELYKEISYPVAATFQGGFRIVQGIPVGSISLSYETPDFNFDEVENVFGTNWMRIEMPPPLHSLPSPPMSSRGNLDVKYDFVGDGLDESIRLKTNSVGSVSHIRFKDRDK